MIAFPGIDFAGTVKLLQEKKPAEAVGHGHIGKGETFVGTA